MSKHISITGGGGFIGRPLTQTLRDAGHTVRSLSQADGDICDLPPECFEADLVLHLAARAFVPDSWKHPEDVYRINTLGTLHALEACRNRGTPFVLMSTYAYGAPKTLPIDERHPVDARNPYALSKLAAEQLALFYAESFQLPITILRPFNPYGPGQPSHFLIPEILTQLLDPEREAVELLDLSPRRDLLYLYDLVDAVEAVVRTACTGIFNIGSGKSHSVEEIARCAMDVAGIEKPLRSKHQPRQQEISDVVADCSALQQATGWTAATDLRTGLARTLETLST